MMQTVIYMTAISLALLYLLYFVGRKGRSSPPSSLLLVILTAAALELFDFLSFIQPGDILVWKRISLAVEAVIPPAWLWFSLTYARRNEPLSIPPAQRLLLACSPLFIVSAIVLPVGSFFYSPDFALEKVLFLGNAGLLFYLFLLIYLIVALINLEMTLANADIASRWKIKPELLGSGALLAVMVFYYSQGFLFRTINMELTPVRTLVLVMAVAMMSYSRLKRGNGVKIQVSSRMAYKSVVLGVVAIYLIGLGIVGEGMKHFGDSFQRAMTITVAFVGGLGLVAILLSETVKRRLLVFIHKNFYQNKYDYRHQWLQFTDRLSSSQDRDDLLRSIVGGFCNTFGMGCGALFLLDCKSGTYQQAAGIAVDTPPVAFSARDPGLERLAGNEWVADLRNGSTEIGSERQRSFFKAIQASFAIPLIMKEGMDGFIVLGMPLNCNETYNHEDFDLMKTLARQASSALLNLRLSDQLASSREMAAIGKVSTFVMHDLKNLVSSISMMLENARDYIALPEFQQELLASLNSTVSKMNRLILRLRRLPKGAPLQTGSVDLFKLASDTAALVGSEEVRVSGTSVTVMGDREELQKVALNLMLNALESTEGKLPVTVEVGGEDAPYIRVKDSGCGIPEDFLRNHIFTPFKTTKQKGLGIGLYQCKQIVEAHGGRIEVRSEPHSGSEFTVRLQKANSSEDACHGKTPDR